MNSSAIPITFVTSGLFAIFIFTGVFLAVWAGRRIGHQAHRKSNGSKNSTDDTLIGSILGLMALVLAFTFSGAAGRLDQRERLISAETSAIASAYAALRYVEPSEREALKSQFRLFITQRALLYDDMSDLEAFTQRQREIDATISHLQDLAYGAALKTTSETRPLATEFVKLVNAMGSSYANQLQAMWFHPPRIIWAALVILILIGSFLAGYKMGVTQRHERLLTFMFAALITSVIYLIFSLEFPLLFRISNLESDVRQAEALQEMLSPTKMFIKGRQ